MLKAFHFFSQNINQVSIKKLFRQFTTHLQQTESRALCQPNTLLNLLLFSCILSAGIQDVQVKLHELKESRSSALQNIQIAMFKIKRISIADIIPNHTSTFPVFIKSYFFVLNKKMRVAESTFSFSFYIFSQQ